MKISLFAYFNFLMKFNPSVKDWISKNVFDNTLFKDLPEMLWKFDLYQEDIRINNHLYAQP